MSPISMLPCLYDLNLLDEANTIVPVKAYHVPICTVQLESLMDMNWDMTLRKV